MNSKWQQIILFYLLFLGVNAKAQVFTPFSYWKGLSPITIDRAAPIYLINNDVITITAMGGHGYYVWSQSAGDGASITSLSLPVHSLGPAEYVARVTPYTTDVITITSGAASATYDVVTYSPLNISPRAITMARNASQTFTATGGCLTVTPCNGGGAYVFSKVSGGGSITSPGGVFTAPAVDGTTVVQVADLIGNVATATIKVVSVLTISPETLKIAVFSTNLFTAILGSPAYSYSVFAGTGSITTPGGVYTAPAVIGTATVRVTDTVAASSDSTVTIIKPVDIKVGQYFTCALHNEGSVKCWGSNVYGQLGVGSTAFIGDDAIEIGGANQFVDLGTGRTATQIALGLDHVCALLDNASVKCWGRGTHGQLGRGTTAHLGDGANEMGDNLSAINLGTGRTATEIFAFGYISCAKLDNSTTKCWGRNNQGQMGIGDTAGNNTNLGDGPNEMGNNLLPLDLGTGKTVTKLTGGLEFVCGLLNDATVKCWGRNNRGQLGKDNTQSLGDDPNEMGDNLTAININGNSGGARTAIDLVSGYDYSCVSRDNASMICWGRNDRGQLGNNTTNSIGDGAGEMAAIAAINMGAGFGALTNIYAAGQNTCAKDSANMFKCWGRNDEGQLLLGNTTDALVPPAGALNIGTGLVILKMHANFYTLCALFSNDRIKCWGRGTAAGGAVHGVFISTSANHLGDAAGEAGDSLNYLNH